MTYMQQQQNQVTFDPKICTTIPIELGNGVYLNQKKAREYGAELSSQYCSAEPYPHIVIDNFLPNELAECILDNFPVESEKKVKSEYDLNYSGIQVHKRQIFPNNCNEISRNIFNFFNSASFLQFLEGLTKIEGLISDPYYNGGGFHEIFPGGKLGVHADFRINEQLHLSRRLNVLIYLNKNWLAEFGGNLEIWDRQMKKKIHSITPIFNRCVIFNTDATSFHGHPEPLTCPPSLTRKSVALYYYTASKSIYEEVPSSTTMYVSRPNEDSYTRKQARKLRLQNYAKDLLPPIVFRNIRKLKKKSIKSED